MKLSFERDNMWEVKVPKGMTPLKAYKLAEKKFKSWVGVDELDLILGESPVGSLKFQRRQQLIKLVYNIRQKDKSEIIKAVWDSGHEELIPAINKIYSQDELGGK
jgi:hypothetical protein